MAVAPAIIRKKVRKQQGGHHGGAWKVAYADFVTAMMAFFLLLWLLNAVTQDKLVGISDYFAPVTTQRTTSGGGGLLQGTVIDADGVFDATARRPGKALGSARAEPGEADRDDGLQPGSGAPNQPSDEDIDRAIREREEAQFRAVQQQIRDAVAATADMQVLANNLLMDNTAEGLRIQIIDQEGLPMFPRGSAEMYGHTRQILELIARFIDKLPQDMAITGHTDATPFARDNGYGNWELSADRANAARRALLLYGLPERRVARVVGKAAIEPLLPQDPAAPGNRRLTLVLLRGTGNAR